MGKGHSTPTPRRKPAEADSTLAVRRPPAKAASAPHSRKFARALETQLAETEAEMEGMIQSMLPRKTVPSPAFLLQARRNAQAREALLEEFGGLSSGEMATLSGSIARNKASTASRWKAEGTVFSVSHKGSSYFPGFQFDQEGRPLPVIARVVKALATRTSEWEFALWFTTSNGWLAGRRPVDLLASDPEGVARAARRQAEEIAS